MEVGTLVWLLCVLALVFVVLLALGSLRPVHSFFIFLHHVKLPLWFSDVTKPAHYALLHAENVYIDTPDGERLGAWYMPPPQHKEYVTRAWMRSGGAVECEVAAAEQKEEEEEGGVIGATPALWCEQCSTQRARPPIHAACEQQEEEDESRYGEDIFGSNRSFISPSLAPCHRQFARCLSEGRTITVVLYLHGNASTRAQPHRRDLYHLLGRNCPCVHVLALDYRGYAESSGTPSEEGLVTDALAAYAWIESNVAAVYGRAGIATRVVVWGHSLGTGVACAMAERLFSERDSLALFATSTPLSLSRPSLTSPSSRSASSPSRSPARSSAFSSSYSNSSSAYSASPSSSRESKSSTATPGATTARIASPPLTPPYDGTPSAVVGTEFVGLLLEAPFTDIVSTALEFPGFRLLRYVLPFGLARRYLSAIVSSPFRSSHALARVRCPVAIVHGRLDREIPVRFGRELFAHAQRSHADLHGHCKLVSFLEVPHAHHSDICYYRECLTCLSSLLRRNGCWVLPALASQEV